MRFVIVTGMSGGGKSSALKILEDAGYYCVDNLPLPLMDQFMEVVCKPDGENDKVALGLDVRAGSSITELKDILASLSGKGYTYEILFMDADDKTLVKRYKETRRVHPLASQGPVADGIKKERELLQEVKKEARYVMDSSTLLPKELKEELEQIFVEGQQYNNLMVSIMSFGFKNGIPTDADLVFDVRFLPNPYYVEELKHRTGNEKTVQDYVMADPDASAFLDKLQDMLMFLIPKYVEEGRHQLVIAVGCTGGHHRSVTVANKLYERMKDHGEYGLKIYHRDVK